MGSGWPWWLLRIGAVRETNPHWMPLSLWMLWLARPSFAFLARGQLRPQSRQNRNPFCDPELQTEAAVMNEARGPPQTSAVAETRDFTLDLLLGFWHWPKKIHMCTYVFTNINSDRAHLLSLRYSNHAVMTVLREVIPSWITVAWSHVSELKRAEFWRSGASL